MPARKANPAPVKAAAKTTQATKTTQTVQPVKKAIPAKSNNQNTQRNISGILGRVGNVGSIEELAYSGSGVPWISFQLAYTPYDFESKSQGETVWYRCTAFRSLAENVAACVSVGMRVVVSGRGSIQEWTDNEGNARETKQIVCDGVGPDLTFATAMVAKVGSFKPVEIPFDEMDEEPF